MEINIRLKLNENTEDWDVHGVASGWIELEECITFPVKIRNYLDDEGKKKMFVSYPQRQTKDGYAPVVSLDKELKKEVDAYVLKELTKTVSRDLKYIPADNVRVTLLEPKKEGSAVSLRGLASVNLSGVTINGIMVKEGAKGLFVQMPQYKSGNEYRDTVYGTNHTMRYEIRQAVLEAYDKELKKAQSHSVTLEQEKISFTPSMQQSREKPKNVHVKSARI